MRAMAIQKADFVDFPVFFFVEFVEEKAPQLVLLYFTIYYLRVPFSYHRLLVFLKSTANVYIVIKRVKRTLSIIWSC